jgi:hypothetical protein
LIEDTLINDYVVTVFTEINEDVFHVGNFVSHADFFVKEKEKKGFTAETQRTQRKTKYSLKGKRGKENLTTDLHR